MRFGFRRPSFRRRLAARTSWRRYVRHSLGIKAPRGWGWLTNPKKAAYNRIYRRTTVDPIKLLTSRRRRSSTGCMVWVVGVIGGSAGLAWWLA
jgi:hypothetical protein